MTSTAFYMTIVLLGLLLAALFGGDGIHGAEPHRVWLPVIETAPAFSRRWAGGDADRDGGEGPL